MSVSKTRVDAVIFDWGGTLTPWHDIDLEAQWYAYAENWDPVNARSLAKRLCAAELDRWRVQRESAGAKSTGALEQIFLDEGIDIDSARHLNALASYLDFWAPHTYADEQALQTLKDLRTRGIKTGVLSNTLWPAEHHQEVFNRDGLSSLIDACVYSSESPVAKPHADAFSSIVQLLDVSPQACVFVGDRLWDDVHGAQSFGMRGVWIPHSRLPTAQMPDFQVVPDAVAEELLDVVRIIDEWNSITLSEIP